MTSLPIVDHGNRRLYLATIKRRPGQDIIKFYTFIDKVAQSAFTDQPSDLRTKFRDVAVFDLLKRSIATEVHLLCKSKPGTGKMVVYLTEVARHEASLPKEKKRRPPTKCSRCTSTSHTTQQCSIRGPITGPKCTDCGQGKHIARACPARTNKTRGQTRQGYYSPSAAWVHLTNVPDMTRSRGRVCTLSNIVPLR